MVPVRHSYAMPRPTLRPRRCWHYGRMKTVGELADALVAEGRYFPSRGDWDAPLSTYQAGEFQLAVVDAFEYAADNGLDVPTPFIDAALALIVHRPGAHPDDVEVISESIQRIRSRKTT